MLYELCSYLNRIPTIDYIPIPVKGWSINEQMDISPMSTARGWTSYGL